MIISIIQPCFIPWLGYFEQMALADVFVYLDDVQYTKKDWRNNNQLKSQYGVKPVYVPVSNASTRILIADALISYNEKWEEGIINKLSQWYGKAPFFTEIVNLLMPIINHKYIKLVDLNIALNAAICEYINITTPIFRSSEIPRGADDKNSRIIEICKNFTDIDILYDGKSAQNFIDVELFKQEGIQVIFQDYEPKPYSQLWGKFAPYLSIVDLMMNHGNNSNKLVIKQSSLDQINTLRGLV